MWSLAVPPGAVGLEQSGTASSAKEPEAVTMVERGQAHALEVRQVIRLPARAAVLGDLVAVGRRIRTPSSGALQPGAVRIDVATSTAPRPSAGRTPAMPPANRRAAPATS